MSEHIKPYNVEDSKEEQIREMFDRIAPRYDFLNRLLSFRQDVRWRKHLIRQALLHKPVRLLDVATGTGDLALAFAKAGVPEVVGLDISLQMLSKARLRAAELPNAPLFIQGSALEMPFEDGYFDTLSVAFGVRNFQDIRRGLKEMHRVLKPGSRMYILEFSSPQKPLFKTFFSLYNSKIVAQAGRWLGGDAQAYSYLDRSVMAFPAPGNFIDMLEDEGWREVEYQSFSGGLVHLFQARK